MLGPDRTQEFWGLLERSHRICPECYTALPAAGLRAASQNQTFGISIVNTFTASENTH